MATPINEKTIRAALSYVAATDRDIWLRVGMALKAEFGEAGFSLFDAWSQTAENYNGKSVMASWKSFKQSGKVGIGTLLQEAQKNGFNLKQFSPAQSLTANERAQAKLIKLEREQEASDKLIQQQEAAALVAQYTWNGAALEGVSPYLKQKQVTGFGVRYRSMELLVPLVDSEGKLWNVQRINQQGDKYFTKEARVSGCFHLVGDITVADCLLIAEGYATAASLHQATGYPVAVAFNAHNLKHVASAMRVHYPDKQLLICADDDSATEIKSGKNTGLEAAQQAANQVQGRWCKPLGLMQGDTDFNDLMRSLGVDAVKEQISTTLKSETAVSNTNSIPLANLPSDNVHPLQPEPVNIDKPPPNLKRTAKKSLNEGQSLKPFFTVNSEGVFYHGFHEGEPLNAVKICSPLRVIGKTRDSLAGGWGYFLEFVDSDGNTKNWVMPAKMLAGDGNSYRAELLDMGLRIEPSLKAKNHLTSYIQTSDAETRIRCVDRVGWHGDQYVLPDQTIGKNTNDENMLFQSTGGVTSKFKQSGTLAEWKNNVGVYCQGNSRLAFCVSAAFASTLLYHSGVSSGGFHLWGDSSTGKSTAFKVAGSVFGGHDYARNWRMTDNALETVAALHSDAFLLLDEIAQIDPKVVGDTVYMLANEVGKSRATQTASARKAHTWRLLFLSDGEVSLANHMAEVGKGTKGGHDVRMVHISADANQGYGVFETLHGFEDGAKLSTNLIAATGRYYGTPAIAFIQEIAKNSSDYKKLLPQAVAELLAELCPADAHGQVKRVAARFALVGVAGELATQQGITGWANGESTHAAKVCFTDWLDSRGGSGNVEQTNMMQLLPHFIGVHGSSRFTWFHRANDDHAPNTINRAGFKRLINKNGESINSDTDFHKSYGDRMHPEESDHAEIEYFILSDVFQKEICKGMDYKKVAKLYVDKGVIIPTKSSNVIASTTRSERLPTLGTTRCYKIAKNFMSLVQ